MTQFAKEMPTRIFVLGVLLCAFPLFVALFYGWAFKTFMFDDWNLSQC